MASGLQLKVFLAGRVAVEANGHVLDEARFPGRQGRLLFAYLVAEQGRPVPRDELAEAVWGEAPPATWDKALSVIASKLRSLLAERGLDGSVLTAAFGCYRLDLPEGTWVDVIVAANAAQEAEAALAAGDLETAKDRAALAASLVRLPFLPGYDGTWVEAKRRELAEVRARALSVLADACLLSGNAAEAAKWAEQTVALEPFRETGYRRLMEAHVAAGNRAEALRVYERCRRLLADELGTYPSPETESIYRELLETPPAPVERTASVEPEPGGAIAPRLHSRRTVVLAVAIVSLIAAAVAGVLITQGGGSHSALATADSVGFIDASGGRVRSQVPVDHAPTSIAVGDGAVWAANATSDTVSEIDPRSRAVKQTITVGASPSGIAVGGGGVWVANHDENTVAWINPQSKTVVREIAVGSGPTAVAYGHGSVWVTNADDRSVSRIDPANGHVVKTIQTNATGRGIAVGGGFVWVTDESTRTVVQIDPATNTIAGRPTVGTGPTGVAYGEGSIWVANALDDTVAQVDAETLAVRQVIPVADGPSAVAFSNGNVWVGAEFGDRIVRINPRHPATLHSIPIGNRPQGLAAGGGGVWVAVQSSGQGHYGGRLVVLDTSTLDSIDPAVSNLTTAYALLRTVYDGLTNSRPVGGSAGTEIAPDLAAALPQPTDGGRSYTFHLRRGIRYSNGMPLRAADFRRSLEREFTLNGWDAPALAKIVGASRCKPGRPCDLSRGVIVTGPSTLTLRLTAPDPNLLYALAPIAPVPPGTPLKDVGTRPIPSTGPYRIESYAPGRQLTIVRNPHFRVWSPTARPRGYADEIVYRIVRNADQAVNQVLAGRADVLTEEVPVARVPDLAARYPNQLHLVSQQATVWVFVDVRRAPFNDVRVRQALSYAVDRTRMAELHGGALLAQPTCQLVPPTTPGHARYCPYTVNGDGSGAWKAPNLAKARRLVAASQTRGQTVVVWTTSYFHGEGLYLVALLRRLGYRARLHYVPDLARYFAAVQKAPSAQAAFGGWFGAPHAVDILGLFRCGVNYGHFCDGQIDAELAQLANEKPSAVSARLAARIDRELVDRAAVVPLYTPRLPDLTSPRVGNYLASPYGYPLFEQMWIR
jgi:YVTN family beta-propeller protein